MIDKKTQWFFDGLEKITTPAHDLFRPLAQIEHSRVDDILSLIQQQNFSQVDRPVYKWYDPKRFHGWNTFKIYYGIDYHTQVRSAEQARSGNDTADRLDWQLPHQLFDDLIPGKWTQVRVLRLDPGGWLRPHIDKLSDRQAQDPTGYNYIWMPLNEVPGSEMGIWGVGRFAGTPGTVYKFENHRCYHSVINLGDQPRYVLIGMYQ